MFVILIIPITITNFVERFIVPNTITVHNVIINIPLKHLLHHLLVKSTVFSQPVLMDFLGLQAVPAVHLYGFLRKSGHAHPNRCRSLTAID